MRSPRNNPTLASADRKLSAALMTIETRSTSQDQSRDDFFNLKRRKLKEPSVGGGGWVLNGMKRIVGDVSGTLEVCNINKL